MMTLVYVVCANAEEAEKISKSMVEKNLVACGNHWPSNSTFHWEEKLQNEKEEVLILKTRQKNVDAVFKAVKEIHSYDVPAIFEIPVGKVDKDYLKWLYKETE